jgi:molybdopterin synthase sulfur carrier subunit
MKLLAFGISRDIIGQPESDINIISEMNVGELKQLLFERFPELSKLNSMAIAVNETYSADDVKIYEKDVVALIPPVSGG